MADSRGWRGQARTATRTQPVVDSGEVARVAYELYEQRGFEHGHDFEDWLKAEEIVRQRRGR